MEEITIDDLKDGDVLLFAGEKGSPTSWAIKFLTDSDVSHAAMLYNEKDKSIIEETPPRVSVNPAAERFKGRKITVRRLKKNLPMEPVINISTTFLNNLEPYDETGYYLVGVILLYKKFTPDNLVQKAMIKLLKKITSELDKYINKHIHPGKNPMVCSQFVADCYDNAGPDYTLNINGGLLGKQSLTTGTGSILDQVIGIIEKNEKSSLEIFDHNSLKLRAVVPETGEELCNGLKESFDSLTTKESKISDELIEAVISFSHVLHRLYINPEKQEYSIHQVLKSMQSNQNMFTFPGDLKDHCDSLIDVGYINI